MRQIREILRLKHDRQLPNRSIARACAMGAGTVSDYLSRARRTGLGWPLPESLDDAQLEALLFPPPAAPGVVRPAPDFVQVHQELKRRDVTLQLLWTEYIGREPQGYRYSRYCELYHRFAARLSPSMRQVHRAGEKGFVDFSGRKPFIVDRRTGQAVEVELFVGVLGASSYTYAEATATQQLHHWIGANVRMLEFFGGCPQVLVPDCLKSAVTTPCRYEPAINRTYQELAAHYGAAVIPARPYHPKDKPKVEAAVLVVQRWILAALRHHTFFSIEDLNEAIHRLVGELNSRPMKKMGASRRELFERLDRPALRSLPPNRFEMAEWSYPTVNIDYHVQVAHNYYSVPHALIHLKLEARVSATTVEVFYKSRRVASHARCSGRGHYVTLSEHMPASHRAHAEWTPSRLIEWAGKTGEATARLVTAILKSRPHPEQGYRSCLGLMRLGQRHGAQRLEAASRRALLLKAYSYTCVKNVLAAGLDRVALDEPAAEPSTLPVHDNVRGPAYYDEETPC
jgi:transposase